MKNLAYSVKPSLFEPFFIGPYTMAAAKKRVIKSLENLSEALRNLMHDQYPNGYEASITRISNAKNEPIFVFPLETEDSVYLVKVPATKNSAGGYDVESGKPEEFEESGEGGGEDLSNSEDFEEENEFEGDEDDGGEKKGSEASYDPDFDN